MPQVTRLPLRIAAGLLLALAVSAALPRLAGADSVIAPQAPATCISLADSCVTVPVTITRTDSVGVRAYSVTFTLSPTLQLCGIGSPINSAGYLANPSFHVLDHGDGSFTVDETTLGAPCGAVGDDTLFTIQLGSASPSATGTLTVTSVLLRDCDDNDLTVTAGPAVDIAIQQQAPAAVTLSASQRKSGNSASPAGTTDVLVSWTGQPASSSVAVYRKGFGFYPFYDDSGGAAPTAPADAAAALSAGWQLTTVASSGDADRVATRDFWYYVAFVTDSCGNVSAVSNLTSGTHNYELGDISDGATTCSGDNLVGGPDISLLGAHYGASIAADDTLACLDIGPTSNHLITGRPLTDHQVQFEDLVVLAIDYGQVSAPQRMALAGASLDRLSLGTIPAATPGSMLEVPLQFEGSGRVKALSAQLGFDASVLEFKGVQAGDLIAAQNAPALVLSSHPGDVDVASLGSGTAIAGSGTLAIARFRVKSAGDPALVITHVDARDTDGRDATITAVGPAANPAPGATALTRVYPNPVNDAMRVQWSLARAGHVAIGVYDLAGRRVRRLLDADQAAGLGVAGWDARGEDGRRVANGFYVVRLRADGVTQNRTIRVVR